MNLYVTFHNFLITLMYYLQLTIPSYLRSDKVDSLMEVLNWIEKGTFISEDINLFQCMMTAYVKKFRYAVVLLFGNDSLNIASSF